MLNFIRGVQLTYKLTIRNSCGFSKQSTCQYSNFEHVKSNQLFLKIYGTNCFKKDIRYFSKGMILQNFFKDLVSISKDRIPKLNTVLFRKTNNQELIEYVSDLLDTETGDKYIDPDEWKKLKVLIDESEKENNHLSKIWPYTLMSYFIQLCFIQKGKSLFEFLVSFESSFITQNLLSNYMLLLSKENPLETKVILNIYEKIQDSGPIVDMLTLKNVLRAIQVTDKWAESLNLIQGAKSFNNLFPNMVESAILGALYNSDNNFLIKYLDILEENNFHFTLFMYEIAILMAKNDNDKGFDCIKTLINNARKRKYYMPENIAEKVVTSFSESKRINASLSSIDSDGNCDLCKENFSAEKFVSNEEFLMIREHFIDKVLIDEDIYNKTNPEEFKRFKDFFDKNGPFNNIVDSLNVVSASDIPYRELSKRLTLRYLSRNLSKKTLMICRKHMRNWNSVKAIQKYPGVSVFFTDNDSKDDIYILYAALLSGKQSLIVTNDEFRDHSFLLGEPLTSTFRKWQMYNQIMFKPVFKYGKIVSNLKYPLPINIENKPSGSFHFPYLSKEHNPVFKIPSSIVCIRHS